MDLFGFTRSGKVADEREEAIQKDQEDRESKKLAREEKKRKEAQIRQLQREIESELLHSSDEELLAENSRLAENRLNRLAGQIAGDDLSEGDSEIEFNMPNFEKDDGTDASDAQSKTSTLKLPWNEDLIFWFSQFENLLETAGVKAQWTKRSLLHKQLDSKLQDDCRDLLVKKQNEAGDTPYLDLKTRILDLHGPRLEEAYDKACGFVMTGKPSQLAKKLIFTLCPDHCDMKKCCIEGVVTSMWRKQLPPHVKQAVAGLKLGDGQLETTLRLADAVHSAMAPPVAAAAALTIATPPPPQQQIVYVQQPYPPDLDTSADAPALDVAAFRGRGRPTGRGAGYRGNQHNFGYRNYRGGQQRPQNYFRGTGQQRSFTRPANQPAAQPTTPLVHNSQPPPNTGPRHPDNPPTNCCHMHWKYGRSAQFCRASLTCPWYNIIAPPPPKQ